MYKIKYILEIYFVVSIKILKLHNIYLDLEKVICMLKLLRKIKKIKLVNQYLIRCRIYIKNTRSLYITTNFKVNPGSEYNQVTYYKDIKTTVLKNTKLLIIYNVEIFIDNLIKFINKYDLA